MAKNELVCCISCGRDTRRADGLCVRCSGYGGANSAQINDQKDRKMLKWDKEDGFVHE